METDRTVANIARRVQGIAHDGQAQQQFLTDSPWAAQAVLRPVQAEVAATPGLAHGGVRLLDERAGEQAGSHTAGAGRQRNGRLGTLARSQVASLLAWVDGAWFVPEPWFTPKLADRRQRVGLPPERSCATKREWGWQMIQRVQAHGLPFEAGACDDFYGRSGWLRQHLDAAGLLSRADGRADTLVYLTPPDFGERANVPAAAPPRPAGERRPGGAGPGHRLRAGGGPPDRTRPAGRPVCRPAGVDDPRGAGGGGMAGHPPPGRPPRR